MKTQPPPRLELTDPRSTTPTPAGRPRHFLSDRPKQPLTSTSSERHMAKGQKKSNKEIRKPKQAKKPAAPAALFPRSQGGK